MIARILDCSPERYLQDPCARIGPFGKLIPSLSAHTAHDIVARSPAHAYLHHPRLGALAQKADKPKDEGAALHRLILGVGPEIVMIEARDWRTDLARAQRDIAIAQGKIPLLRHRYEELLWAVQQIRAQLADFGISLEGGEKELPIEWYAEGQYAPVLCRSMLDYADLESGLVIDVKKTHCAHPSAITRCIFDYGYDIQAVAHSAALAALRPQLQGRIQFVFLFVEIEPPYSVVPAKLDGAFTEIGEQRWRHGVRHWEYCLARDDWPSYVERPIVLEAPVWLINQQIGVAR